MKKLFTCITLTIVASILFSSCGNRLFLTKRHYRSGYYSELASKQPAQKPQVQQIAYKKQPALVTQQQIKPIVANEVYASNNAITEQKQAVASASVAQKTVHQKHSIHTVFPNSELFVPKKVTETRLHEKPVVSDGGEGRSLFWTIILIILILWAVGFLAGGWGLGGLINLLLLIAVILFILWLLRVI